MDTEFITGNLLVKATHRYTFGMIDYRAVYGSENARAIIWPEPWYTAYEIALTNARLARGAS